MLEETSLQLYFCSPGFDRSNAMQNVYNALMYVTSHIVHFVRLFMFWSVSPGNHSSNIITIIRIGKAVSK